MASLNLALLAFFILRISCFAASELIVQVNVNRPLNDVNEKFISFIMKPEDLYNALDGPYRKQMTRMAALMDNSYVKFLGDYDFTSSVNTNIKNPNKVIWKGFNRWSKAVNWTMIIPVPYQPNAWSPIETLKIFNTSHLVGITDCIWQLGTDFGSSHAADYVNELKTLNLMVDSFRPYVENWQIMGADVSVGSSAEETRRYIEMSKDLNAAFGWTQPADLISSEAQGSYIFDKDPALQMLLSKKVPVWFSLPEKIRSKPNSKSNKINRHSAVETLDAMRWAQTLGDAASSGFDVVFQRINKGDWEKPDMSLFVTALFKKVMGSRVFPAKPLNIFKPNNKLYTHCANSVSGGLAFMVVNTENEPMQISLRSLTKLQGTTIWKYTLTTKKGFVLLNNRRVYMNTTFKPEVKKHSQQNSIHLTTPGNSISFWVFPSANLDHCHFTEVVEEDSEKDNEGDGDESSLTSADKLLKSLIFESSLQYNPLVKEINRKRRYSTMDGRAKRFVLQEQSVEKPLIPDFFKPFALDEKILSKRENPKSDSQAAVAPFDWLKHLIQNPLKVPDLHLLKRPARSLNILQKSSKPLKRVLIKREHPLVKRRLAALDWLRQMIESPLQGVRMPLLKRQARSADDFFGSSLFGKTRKPSPITKKIFDIKKPERKTKPLFDLEEFDEEEFFKKLNDHTEPTYVRVPEGDIHIKHIATPEGDEIDFENEDKHLYSKKKKFNSSKIPKEPKNEMKPLKLLPSEFYEASPPKASKPSEPKINIGATLNSLLFPEPFSKKTSKDSSKQQNKISDDKPEKENPKKKILSNKTSDSENLFSRDFVRSQRQLSKNFPSKQDPKESLEDEDNDEDEAEKADSPEESEEKKPSKDNNKFNKHLNIFEEAFDHLFAEKDLHAIKKTSNQDTKTENKNAKNDSEEEEPWWELSALKKKRSLTSNFITNNEELMPLGAFNVPEQMAPPVLDFEVNDQPRFKKDTEDLTNSLVDSVHLRVTKMMNIVSRHVVDWYKALSKTFRTQDLNSPTQTNSISKI